MGAHFRVRELGVGAAQERQSVLRPAQPVEHPAHGIENRRVVGLLFQGAANHLVGLLQMHALIRPGVTQGVQRGGVVGLLFQHPAQVRLHGFIVSQAAGGHRPGVEQFRVVRGGFQGPVEQCQGGFRVAVGGAHVRLADPQQGGLFRVLMGEAGDQRVGLIAAAFAVHKPRRLHLGLQAFAALDLQIIVDGAFAVAALLRRLTQVQAHFIGAVPLAQQPLQDRLRGIHGAGFQRQQGQGILQVQVAGVLFRQDGQLLAGPVVAAGGQQQAHIGDPRAARVGGVVDDIAELAQRLVTAALLKQDLGAQQRGLAVVRVLVQGGVHRLQGAVQVALLTPVQGPGVPQRRLLRVALGEPGQGVEQPLVGAFVQAARLRHQRDQRFAAVHREQPVDGFGGLFRAFQLDVGQRRQAQGVGVIGLALQPQAGQVPGLLMLFQIGGELGGLTDDFRVVGGFRRPRVIGHGDPQALPLGGAFRHQQITQGFAVVFDRRKVPGRRGRGGVLRCGRHLRAAGQGEQGGGEERWA